jgi:hypothetical protein
VEAGAVAIGFAKEIDDVLVKLYKNAKFELDGTGTYLPTIRGHHPLREKHLKAMPIISTTRHLPFQMQRLTGFREF